MDTKQIEYILKIADEKSITKAAAKLFITQSALSQQLQKLEAELETPLFIRNKSDWFPTPEGEVYLKNAREILRIKQNTYAEIADMAGTRKSYLSVGITPGRGPDMFTHVYPLFHKKYPQITVEPRELSVKKQQEEIRKGTLDLGFMTLLEEQKSQDTYIELFKEELFLGIPEAYPAEIMFPEILSESADEYPEISLDFFKHEPFVLMYKESTVRKIVDRCFLEAGFEPNILFETSANQTVISMIQAELCVGLIPYHYVKQKPEGVRFLRIKGNPNWSVCASYHKDAYLSQAAKEFIDLAEEYWLS